MNKELIINGIVENTINKLVSELGFGNSDYMKIMLAEVIKGILDAVETHASIKGTVTTPQGPGNITTAKITLGAL